MKLLGEKNCVSLSGSFYLLSRKIVANTSKFMMGNMWLKMRAQRKRNFHLLMHERDYNVTFQCRPSDVWFKNRNFLSLNLARATEFHISTLKQNQIGFSCSKIHLGRKIYWEITLCRILATFNLTFTRYTDRQTRWLLLTWNLFCSTASYRHKLNWIFFPLCSVFRLFLIVNICGFVWKRGFLIYMISTENMKYF